MRVFVSLAAGLKDAQITTALRSVRSEAKVVLPDRSDPAAVADAIASAAAVLVVARRGVALDAVQADVHLARGKPIVALLEDGVSLDGVPPEQIARFGTDVFAALFAVPRAVTAAGVGDVLAGLAIAAMGTVARS